MYLGLSLCIHEVSTIDLIYPSLLHYHPVLHPLSVASPISILSLPVFLAFTYPLPS